MNDETFKKFWSAYPRKVGKDAALKAWLKKKPDINEVLNALDWQKQSDQWMKDNGKFIPHPATYLNQGRWQDEPTLINNANKTIHDTRAETAKAMFGGFSNERTIDVSEYTTATDRQAISQNGELIW